MATDLEAVAARPDDVGLVDHPDREPEGRARRRGRSGPTSWAPGSAGSCGVVSSSRRRPSLRGLPFRFSEHPFQCGVLAYQPTMPNGSRSPMERWIAVLDAFTTRDDWGVRELASAVGLSPTATHRMLHEMARTGLLAPAAGRGQPGRPELARLAVLTPTGSTCGAGRPILEATAEAIDETVILALYSPAAAASGRSTRPRPGTRSATSGSPYARGAICIAGPAARESWRSCPRTSARRSSTYPGAREDGPGAALDRARSAGVVILATVSGSRARSGSRPRSATPPAGSSATSSRAGRTANRTDAGKEQRVAAAIVDAAGSLQPRARGIETRPSRGRA